MYFIIINDQVKLAELQDVELEIRSGKFEISKNSSYRGRMLSSKIESLPLSKWAWSGGVLRISGRYLPRAKESRCLPATGDEVHARPAKQDRLIPDGRGEVNHADSPPETV